uniref:Uncharacterized protein n=1 Tax=Anguilla anguilla TaxID=7936 RepID=A0A0E9S4Q6_ANGAN
MNSHQFCLGIHWL